MAASDYSVDANLQAATVFSKSRGSKIRKNINTFSMGTNSDVSTTVVAPSQTAKGHNVPTFTSVNFNDLGLGALINETPRSKRSVDFGSKKILSKQRTTEVSKTNLGLERREKKVIRSFSRQNIKERASTRNMVKPNNGLTHFNFI